MKMKRMSKILTFIMIFTLILTGCTGEGTTAVNNQTAPSISNQLPDKEINKTKPETNKEIDKTKPETNKEIDKTKPETNVVKGENLEVHFIDVGQGDSILIKQGENSLLIDAGDNKYGKTVVNYLKSQNITKLDYVIGTHPHADHIGGLDDVINTFKVDNIIMPNKMHSTKTFEDVLKAIDNQGLKITTPKVGDTYKLGEAQFTILAPNSQDYKNLNDFSISTKIEYGTQSFFFSGDCETSSENEIVNNGLDIKSTVMKAGHHGSNTSNTDLLLDKVNPDFVVIQVGEGNKYNHPNQDILDRFQRRGITVYRNDIHGNVVVTTDGETLDFETKKNSANVVTQTKSVAPVHTTETKSVAPVHTTETNSRTNLTSEISFIGTKTTKKFHKPDCRHIPKPENQVNFANIDEAITAGYEACKVCKPQ